MARNDEDDWDLLPINEKHRRLCLAAGGAERMGQKSRPETSLMVSWPPAGGDGNLPAGLESIDENITRMSIALRKVHTPTYLPSGEKKMRVLPPPSPEPRTRSAPSASDTNPKRQLPSFRSIATEGNRCPYRDHPRFTENS